MMTNQLSDTPTGDLPDQESFFFEIRVKTRLSEEQWTGWFDELQVHPQGGETILRGRAADHAALYGVIGRLRDLAVPLLSVRVLDSKAQGRMLLRSRRLEMLYTAMLALVFAMVIGALSALAVFFSPSVIGVGLAMAILFVLLGGLGHLFFFWSGKAYWHWLAHMCLAGSFLSFLIFIPTSGLMPTTAAIALMLLLAAGGALVIGNSVRGWADEAAAVLAGSRATGATADPMRKDTAVEDPKS